MKKTDKKSMILLSLCTLGMLLVLAGLYALSPLADQKVYQGSFNRSFAPTNTITKQNVLDIGVNSYYISGITEGEIYLSNYTAPNHLLRADISLKDTQQIKLKITGLDSVIRPRQFRTVVEPPYFFMMHGITPTLLRGKINKWEAHHFMPDSAYYAKAIPIDTNAFAIRYYSKSQKSYELALETAKAPHFKYNYDLLEKQVDGFFCVDGMLHYSKELEKIIYLYAYRNEYMIIDKNLNLLHRYNTIDTISRARVRSEEIKSEDSFTLTSQPARTNIKSCISGKYLFIQSGLLAQNEDEGVFIQNAVIDVYDVLLGIYVKSFYLHEYKKQSLSDFKIYGNYLVALHGPYLSTYKLNMENLSPKLQL